MPLPMLIFATNPVICPSPTSRPLPTWRVAQGKKKQAKDKKIVDQGSCIVHRG